MNYQSLESSGLLKGVVRSRPVCIGMELWKHCSLLSSFVGNEQTSRGNNPGQQLLLPIPIISPPCRDS